MQHLGRILSYPRVGLYGRRSLAQAPLPANFTVAVSDVRGKPWSGAQVQVLSGAPAASSMTDSSGQAQLPIPPGNPDDTVSVRVQSGSLVQIQQAKLSDLALGQTVFVVLPVRSPEDILTPVELVAIVVGVGSTVAGIAMKSAPLSTAGEILIGAGIFTSVFRHSC